MSLFGFGKRPKHRSFDYVPRYYDAEKEDLQNRLSTYDPDSGDDVGNVKLRLKGSFKKPIGKTYETDAYKAALKRSNRIVLVVALILILCTIYFLMEYFPKYVEGLHLTN